MPLTLEFIADAVDACRIVGAAVDRHQTAERCQHLRPPRRHDSSKFTRKRFCILHTMYLSMKHLEEPITQPASSITSADGTAARFRSGHCTDSCRSSN